MEKKKRGRPTDDPRKYKLGIRITEEEKEILETYCECHKVTKTEAISRGLKLLNKAEG